MSFFGNKDDAKKWANEAVHVIDGETTTSPLRDGGGSMDVGGAPIATNLGGGAVHFTQDRTRTGIQDHEVGNVVRQYGQKNPTKYRS